MFFADKFLKHFFPDYSLINKLENDENFICEISTLSFSPAETEVIKSSFNFLLNKDNFSFIISFGEADPISLYSSSLDFPRFLDGLKNEYTLLEGELITAKLVIDKQKNENRLSIYDLSSFINTLLQLSIYQLFVVFNRAFSNTSFIEFEVIDLVDPFFSNSIYFLPVGHPSMIVKENRIKQIENLQSVSYYTNFNDHHLTPDDFRLIKESHDKTLNSIFKRNSIILSIIYLYDITSINSDELDFKISGYKSFKGTINLKSIDLDKNGEYNEIFKWVYSGGNLNDKIGLARNIITLHLEKDGSININGSPFHAIQSSFKVYEKQNIKQYIEIRNKISDQLLDFNNRANKVIETFASGFQKSALALISFYISAIVVRILSKGEFVNVFTFDATILSIAFILGSYIYYRISRWEVLEQRQRFVDSYNNLKERYTDLLEKDDIQRILNNDKEFNSDFRFINNKLRNYSNMWLGFLGILFLTTITLFMTYNMSKLFNSTIWMLLFNKSCTC